MTKKLSLETLASLDPIVGKPSYAREDLSPGIVHIGVGNFHRAHQIVYLDRLFNKGMDHDWGVIGAGIKHYDAAMRDRLQGQDWLSTVIELDPEGLSARVTGVMIDFTAIDAAALLQTLVRPEIRIVSLTITEGGYYVNATTHGFDVDHPEIQGDIANPKAPQTIFGLLIAALAERKEKGLPAFTIMSCDNLPENGKVARQTVLGLAREIAPELAGWIEETVAFPSSMVDCITPVTSEKVLKLARDQFGIEDNAPVACEPFHQWVLEDHFPAGRPRLEEVGVEFVEDVAPYELMKLRILNGGHAAIAYPSALLGHDGVHEAMADADIADWLKTLARREIIPVVPEIPGIDFDAYLETCADRFANAAVGDSIARLCLDGSNRQPKFILPSISDALEAGRSIDGLALEVALWCRYCAAIAEGELQVPHEDERATALQAAAREARERPDAFLELTEVFGTLGQEEPFKQAFAKALNDLWQNGTRATLKAYLQKEGA